jgi:serine/threonine protein kinase
MHRRNIIHRDLKPQNILITDRDVLMVCIADLGLAIKDFDIKGIAMKCGTPGYVDPDVLKGNNFITKSDIFSLGSVLYNIITLRLLYGGNSIE